MNWKINRDYYYKDLYPLLGQDGIEEAGYFEDSATYDIDIKKSIPLLCTPIAPITRGLYHATNPCVLLSTGSFCPIHQGHIDMMTLAKETVEKAGYQVVGGYLSAGHDEYINYKVKDKAIPIHQRILLIQELINKNGLEDWLMPDSWEGVFAKVAVNFTDVVYRLELYLEHFFKRKIPVFFVCGGDNARFAMTFMQKGHCVVVGRPSYESRYELYQQKLLNYSNILWSEGESDLSSTKVRSTQTFELPSPKELYLRVEGEDPREKEIIALLSSYFPTTHLSLLAEQQEIYQKICRTATISLDAYIPSHYNLHLSRIYDFMGIQQLGYINRPGSPSLKIQAAAIPAGNYCLFDDDIHSGNTMKFAQQLLEQNNKKIMAIIALNLYKKKSSNPSEVLDCRDFLIGNFYSGLVVELDGVVVRVPYVYPYVCPYVRASILDPMKFSIEVWKINLCYYQKNQQFLKNCPNHVQQLFSLIGFDKESTLEAICHWHLDMLQE